jgi:hypothetical protein
MNTSNNDIASFLSEGRVQFSYTKANGDSRQATGTTNMDLIPEGARAEATNTAESAVITYFDLDKNDWRSFRRENLKAESITQQS